MIIKLTDFLQKLETLSYLNYQLYRKEEILVITLFTSEELEKYLIREDISEDEHLQIISTLEKYRQ